MSGDYKDDIQAIAEDLAWEVYDRAFYSLDAATQQTIYSEAMEHYWGKYEAKADEARERPFKEQP